MTVPAMAQKLQDKNSWKWLGCPDPAGPVEEHALSTYGVETHRSHSLYSSGRFFDTETHQLWHQLPFKRP